LGLLLLAYPAYLGYRATVLPAINDVTTDPDNPPRFEALLRARPAGRSIIRAPKPRRCNVRPIRRYAAATERTAKDRLRHRACAGHQTQMADRRYALAGYRRRDAVIEAVAQTMVMGSATTW